MIADPQRDPPDLKDVQIASERLRGVAVHTPLLKSRAIDELVDRPVWFKPECLQHTGSFKFRGAWNRCAEIPVAARRAGVVAFSSGNHAQGVAESAARFGMPATIVMPADAPRTKKAGVTRCGAQIIEYDRAKESREEIATRIADDKGATLIRPFEDAFVIAGQATATLEAIADADVLGLRFDAMLCPASGGGLIAGAAIVLEEKSPGTELFVVEPRNHDDHLRSLKTRRRQRNPKPDGTIADALMAPEPGELTFSINQSRLAGGFPVTDEEMLTAMRLAFQHLRLVLEPAGAAPLAALLHNHQDLPGKGPILVVLSGGNVDDVLFRRTIASSGETEI